MRVLGLVVVTCSALLVAGAASAQGMGMGGGAATGGSGMLQVAGDGSLLVVRMEAGMMGGGQPGVQRSVTDVAPSGQERWRTSFDSGWPTMVATNGDLVVVVLADDWWMGGSGDGRGQGADRVTLVGLDLASGAERWRTQLDGDMGSWPQFAPDGATFYVSLREMGGMGGPGGGPMHQGDAAGAGTMMRTALAAVNRAGNVLWTLDLGGGQMGGPPAAGRRP